MRGIRAFSAFTAGAALALTVAACTGSTTTVVQKSGTSGPAQSAGRSASPSTKPSPAGPVVTITPGNGAGGADPSKGIAVTAAGGTLKSVVVTTAGNPVTGTY